MSLPHPLQGLREIRRARNLSASDMAELLNIAPTSYSRFEIGSRRAYFDKVVAIADRLGVRTDDLRKLIDEQDAIRLCDQRDKEAIAAGTFNPALWERPEPKRAPGPPPPPPEQPVATITSAAVPPPPPLTGNDDDEDVTAIMAGWDQPE